MCVIFSGGAKGPGIFFIIPCIDSYQKVDLRTVSFDVPPQEVCFPNFYLNWFIFRVCNLNLWYLGKCKGSLPRLCDRLRGRSRLLQGVKPDHGHQQHRGLQVFIILSNPMFWKNPLFSEVSFFVLRGNNLSKGVWTMANCSACFLSFSAKKCYELCALSCSPVSHPRLSFLFWWPMLLLSSSHISFPASMNRKHWRFDGSCVVSILRGKAVEKPYDYWLFFLVIQGARLSRTPSLSGTLEASLRPGGGVWGCLGSKLWWGGTGIWTPDLLLEIQECNHYATGAAPYWLIIIPNQQQSHPPKKKESKNLSCRIRIPYPWSDPHSRLCDGDRGRGGLLPGAEPNHRRLQRRKLQVSPTIFFFFR